MHTYVHPFKWDISFQPLIPYIHIYIYKCRKETLCMCALSLLFLYTSPTLFPRTVFGTVVLKKLPLVYPGQVRGSWKSLLQSKKEIFSRYFSYKKKGGQVHLTVTTVWIPTIYWTYKCAVHVWYGLCGLHASCNLILTATIWGGYHYQPHFIGEKAEAQKLACSELHGHQMMEFKASQSILE